METQTWIPEDIQALTAISSENQIQRDLLEG